MIIGLPNGNSGLSAHLWKKQILSPSLTGFCPSLDSGLGHTKAFSDGWPGFAVAAVASDARMPALCGPKQDHHWKQQQHEHPRQSGADGHGFSWKWVPVDHGSRAKPSPVLSGERGSGPCIPLVAVMTIALLLRLGNRLSSSHGETPLSNHGLPSKNHLQ